MIWRSPMKNVRSYPFLRIGMVVLSVLALAGLPKQAAAGEKMKKKSNLTLCARLHLPLRPTVCPMRRVMRPFNKRGLSKF